MCQRCANLSVHCEWGAPVKRSHAVQRRELQPVRPRPTHPEKINLDYSTLERLWRDHGASRLMGSSDSVRPAALPFLPHYADPSLSPLCAPVSVPEVACANSLVLSKQDQRYFQYFPSSSIVFYYMKSWPWSSFSYLYQGPAATNNVIMRMIMAVSAGDVHRHELEIRSPGRPTAEDYARYHYGLAVKEFRQMLETPRQDVSRSTLEMIFLAMFLLIMYEWQFGNVRNLQLHLRGVRSLLEMHPELFQDRGVNSVFSLMDVDESDQALPKLSLAPVQMLLWILYAPWVSHLPRLILTQSGTWISRPSRWVYPTRCTIMCYIPGTHTCTQTICTNARACGDGVSGESSIQTKRSWMTTRTTVDWN